MRPQPEEADENQEVRGSASKRQREDDQNEAPRAVVMETAEGADANGVEDYDQQQIDKIDSPLCLYKEVYS